MSTLSKFPLFKLPVLCIENILIQCHSYDLINFSFLSKKCHQIVKSLRNRFDGLHIFVYKSETKVQIEFNRKTQGNWYFNSNDFGKEEQIVRSIGGCKMKTCIKGIHFYSYVDENIQFSVKAGIEYLTDLFKLPIVRVVLHSDDIPEKRRPLVLGFNECKGLKIVGKNPMDNNELRNILEHFEWTEVVQLDIPIDESFHCDVIKSKGILCENGGKWVKSQQLFIPKLVKLSLFPCSFQPNELQSFVKFWFYSTNRELEFVGLVWQEPIGELKFESLPLIPWSKKQRSHAYKHSPNKAIDCSEGMDLLRNDGELATILVRPKMFFFCVWHTRFHDLTGATIK